MAAALLSADALSALNACGPAHAMMAHSGMPWLQWFIGSGIHATSLPGMAKHKILLLGRQRPLAARESICAPGQKAALRWRGRTRAGSYCL